MKRKTVHAIGGNPRAYLQEQLKIHDQVVMQFTNYTTAIITDHRKVLFHVDKNIKKPFGIFQKIKASIRKSGVFIPEIPKDQIRWNYFDLNINFPENFVSVDISSAYAKVLLNYGLINQSLFDEMTKKIPKEDRLKSVGLLGTIKTQVTYRKGEAPIIDMIKSDFAKYFFFCCHVTGEVMELARRRAKEDFIYFWVDGIAVRKERATEIMNYIESLGFPSKLEYITECKKGEGVITYRKDGKKKTLHLPKRRTVENSEAIDFLFKTYESDKQKAI